MPEMFAVFVKQGLVYVVKEAAWNHKDLMNSFSIEKDNMHSEFINFLICMQHSNYIIIV